LWDEGVSGGLEGGGESVMARRPFPGVERLRADVWHWRAG
jgi:hypothetical protein